MKQNSCMVFLGVGLSLKKQCCLCSACLKSLPSAKRLYASNTIQIKKVLVTVKQRHSSTFSVEQFLYQQLISVSNKTQNV